MNGVFFFGVTIRPHRGGEVDLFKEKIVIFNFFLPKKLLKKGIVGLFLKLLPILEDDLFL